MKHTQHHVADVARAMVRTHGQGSQDRCGHRCHQLFASRQKKRRPLFDRNAFHVHQCLGKPRNT